MPTSNASECKKQWSASELRRMTPEQRESCLMEASMLAEEDYCTDRDLTNFEAFGEADLYGNSVDTQSR